jgi:hypothetical protein
MRAYHHLSITDNFILKFPRKSGTTFDFQGRCDDRVSFFLQSLTFSTWYQLLSAYVRTTGSGLSRGPHACHGRPFIVCGRSQRRSMLFDGARVTQVLGRYWRPSLLISPVITRPLLIPSTAPYLFVF